MDRKERKRLYNLEYNRQHNYERSRSLSSRYSTLKSKARQRGLICTLSYDEYQEIILDARCLYCQAILPEVGYGLDRIDSAKGYVQGNVVPCCTSCNRIKGNWFSQNEMIIVMQAVITYRRVNAL